MWVVQTTLGILFLARKYEKSKYCLHSHGENLSVVGIVFTTGKLLTPRQGPRLTLRSPKACGLGNLNREKKSNENLRLFF